MFEFCADPSHLEGIHWWSCYLTTVKHGYFYTSFLTVLALLACTAPLIMILGFFGAIARLSRMRFVRALGTAYTNVVRGVPDIIFFLFVPIALDQAMEYLRHKTICPDWSDPIRQGNDFVVCNAAKLPLGSAPQWIHESYGFTLAVISFGIVYGAFAANIIFAALSAIPAGQTETAKAFGMSWRKIFWRIELPQMWVYALPGLSNLWALLIKATPLLFLLGVEDIVYWARELGGSKTSRFAYPHDDWRLWYFLVLLVFYLMLTWVSERVFARLFARMNGGQANVGNMK